MSERPRITRSQTKPSAVATPAAAAAAPAAKPAAPKPRTTATEQGTPTPMDSAEENRARQRAARTGFRPVNREDDGAKPSGGFSTRSQWQERVARPVATRAMTPDQINEFRDILDEQEAAGEPSIKYRFIRIIDPNDEEVKTCINLQFYSLARGPRGSNMKTPVFMLKMPIPDNVQAQMAEVMKAQVHKPPPRRRRPLLAADAESASKSTE